MRVVTGLVALFAVVAVSGCHKAPNANAGMDRTVNTGAVVQLDGSMSSDPDGKLLAFSWSFRSLPSGSAAALNNPRISNPSFLADVPGEYVLQLVVSDDNSSSGAAVVTVTAATCGSATPTVEVAANPPVVGVNTTVQFAALVKDADNDPPCSAGETFRFQFSLVAQPKGSVAKLNNPTAQGPSLVPDVVGDYAVSVVVTDSTGRSSAPKSATVSVTACGAAPPVVSPISAMPATPNTGDTVQLTAAVTDADQGCSTGDGGFSETFAWAWALVSQPSGSRATLNNPAATNPSFVADVPGSYQLSLMVTDSTGRSSTPVTTTVTVVPCGSFPPVALVSQVAPNTTPAGAAVTAPDVQVGATVQLATLVSDGDSACGFTETFSYRWRFIALAAASRAAFDNAQVQNPSFVADQPGTYLIGVTVTDSTGRSSSEATLAVTANPAVGVAFGPVGFSIVTVAAGPGAAMNGPHGVTVDGNGNIYVCQRDGASIMEYTTGGAIIQLARGGLLVSPEDIVFDAANNRFIFTQGNDTLYNLTSGGLPSVLNVLGNGSNFYGIALWTSSAGTPRLTLGDVNNDQVLFTNPTPPPDLNSVNDFSGGNANALRIPWGVAAMVNGGADVTFVASGNNRGLWRNIGGALTDNSGANRRLITGQLLSQPRSVVLTPCPTPKIVVANRGNGTLVVVDNCTPTGNASCNAQVFGTGLGGVVGLHFDLTGATPSLLVTSEDRNALFRISGNFCSL